MPKWLLDFQGNLSSRCNALYWLKNINFENFWKSFWLILWYKIEIEIVKSETNKSIEHLPDSQKPAEQAQLKQANNQNVFHPNYIKRYVLNSNESFNRKKRSSLEDNDGKNYEDDDYEMDAEKFQDAQTDFTGSTLPKNSTSQLEPEPETNLSSAEKLNEDLDEESDQLDAFASIKAGNRTTSADEQDNLGDVTEDENQTNAATTRPSETTTRSIEKVNLAESKRINQITDRIKIKDEKQPIDSWPLEIDNDLEKSIYEAFQELIDDWN